jgi:hypothetical protein
LRGLRAAVPCSVGLSQSRNRSIAGSTKKARFTPISSADTRSPQLGSASTTNRPFQMNSGAAAQSGTCADTISAPVP